ncbi:MAG: hypothetical protein CMH63_02410 [Nanoarchaeota archaeon]|nr:hypothetical protein [Nanoarchaeota archaeon]|tara:strand:- start:2644 stop:3696 length:1053 start_codon:yes stop_codon:yes gene_type:complete
MNQVGILPVSMGKPYFGDRENMEFYVRYLDDNFSEGHVLVVDSPKRYNLMALEGITEEEALGRIEEHYGNYEKMVSGMLTNTGVSLRRFNDFWDEKCEENLQVFGKAYGTDSEFRADANGLIGEFLEGTRHRTERGVGPEEVKDYFLEEMSLLSAISTRFPLVEVYPGISALETRLYNLGYDFAKNLHLDRNRKFWEVFADEDRFKHPLKVGNKRGVGKTLYTRRDFHEGEFAFRVEGPLVTSPSTYTVPVASDLYLDPKNEGKYLCHSCNPSCGMRNRNEVVAMRDVRAGEEISIDYGMVVSGYDLDLLEQDLECRCRSRNCRGELGSWETLPDGLKERYKGFVSGYLE